MQPLQGKNWFLLASQPRGGAPLTLGYYMQPLGQKPEPRVLICRMNQKKGDHARTPGLINPTNWFVDMVGAAFHGGLIRKHGHSYSRAAQEIYVCKTVIYRARSF